ncbi:class I SAM-dependent methyltransferase [Jatrophihabitans sp.]|uniref:class I SAM-dependent methyltransferase n=1 Tax=Jatrophihabitans sp. TaxID=1932789 RepID=UPI0030C6DC85|nr:putative type 11 methyltransferase [Jatrophihabitans sp.]
MSEAMAAEFDTVAAWTAEVAVELGAEYYIPAGCRGSGSPAALAWLSDALSLTGSEQVLDAGAGVGGPAAYLAARTGVRPVLVEPEAGACRAAARLFGLPLVQADATALPLATGSFDAAWCLGVLCTTDEQATLLAELRRVLTPDGRLGMLVFTATEAFSGKQPEGNTFTSEERLHTMIADAGLRVVASAPNSSFGPEPERWQRQLATIDAELERRHAGQLEWQIATRQSAVFGELLATGQIEGSLLVLESAGGSSSALETDVPSPHRRR